MLKRSGYDIGPAISVHHGERGDRADLGAYPRLMEYYRMHPALIAGATLFGEQARQSHILRQTLKKLELKLAEEQTQLLWDEVEAERKKPP